MNITKKLGISSLIILGLSGCASHNWQGMNETQIANETALISKSASLSSHRTNYSDVM